MKLNKWFYLIALSLIWGSSFILIKKALVGLEASQLGSLTFIGEGSTKRKEILAKFLDLEIFEKKFKMIQI